MRDTKHLTRRGGETWYAIMAVPRPLRAAVGRANLRRSLQTTDIHVARARRHAALAEFHAVLDKARGAQKRDRLTDAALSYRTWLDELNRGEPSAIAAVSNIPRDVDPVRYVRATVANLVDEEADDIEAEHGAATAAQFVGIARGTATPILLNMEAWLAEGGKKGPLNERTKAQYRADLRALAAWLAKRGIGTVEAVTKAIAGQWITETIVSKGVHWATGNRRISAPASYWRWMQKRAGIEGDPWRGQSLAKGPARKGADKSKRPFTDAELARLLAGDATPELADAMRVAALSGMRLEEIYRLKVADCAGGWFNVREAKTAAGVRRVPVHPDLAAIVDRRREGKKPEAFLFPEAGPAKVGRGRSAALSKRFGRYRQDCGVHERADGARHSRVDFHSFRRWFITTARNAGIERATVAAVVGHTAQDVTDGVYRGDVAEALLRACVEAVRLPAPV